MKIYNKLKAIFAIIVITISSCNKDTNTPPSSQTTAPTSVIGNWSLTAGYEGASQTGTYSNFPVASGYYLNLINNNTYTSNFSFTLIGMPSASSNDNGTYTYNSSTSILTITSTVTGKTITATILTLSSTQLQFDYQVYWSGSNWYKLYFVQ